LASTTGEQPDLGRDLLRAIAAVFAESGVRAALIGGQAVNLFLEPRLTFDIDFTVLASAESLDKARELLAAEGFELTNSQVTDPKRGFDFLRFHHGPTGLGIDISQASTEFEELAIERARKVDASQPMAAATPEDLIVFKLIANRQKDHRDAVELLQLEGLDWGYIERWAATWQVEDRLQELRDLIARTNR